METTDPRQAGFVILSNLEMFNDAALLMEEQITVAVFEEVQKIVQQWISDNGWKGESRWLNDERNIWMSKPNWYLSTNEQELQVAVMWFGYENDDTQSYDVADLCGCGQSRLGFYFGKSDYLKNPIWKILKSSKLFDSAEWNSCEFINNSDMLKPWFRPVLLDKDKLAEAYRKNDFDEAMVPLREALEDVIKDQEIFDKIVSEVASAIK